MKQYPKGAGRRCGHQHRRMDLNNTINTLSLAEERHLRMNIKIREVFQMAPQIKEDKV